MHRRAARPRVLLAVALLACAVVVAVGCTTGAPTTPATPALVSAPTTVGADGAPIAAIETNATVVKITDGDTIHVERNGTDQTIRLIGMDTPETKKPNTPVECFGQEAAAHLQELLPIGTRVRLERDVEERDRYDRILAYVYRDDGLFVNLEMVRDGYAGQLTVPPNVTHADEFGDAARTARDQGKGLWSACGGNHAGSPATP